MMTHCLFEYSLPTGEVHGLALEELVEHLSFNKEVHVDDHVDNVGVLRPSTVPARTIERKSQGRGAPGGAHVAAVEAESRDGGMWVSPTSEAVGPQVAPSLSTMQGATVLDTQAASSPSMLLGATAVDVSIRSWKRNARKGQGSAVTLGPVTTHNKQWNYNPSGQAGVSTRGGKHIRGVAPADGAESPEMAVAACQPRHQL